MQPLFTLKPDIVGAALPHYLRWLRYFAVAGGLVYGTLLLLARDGRILIPWWALPTLAAIAIIGALVHVKHRLVRTYCTTYRFYDNRVVEEFRLLVRRRHSIPYNQIKRLTHQQRLWQRFLDVADIKIETEDEDSRPMLLRAIKKPEAVEHRIYRLMKEKKED